MAVGPLQARTTLSSTQRAKKVFWHSSAHVLGEAAERHYGCHLCLGLPTDEASSTMGMQDRLSANDYPALEKVCDSATNSLSSARHNNGLAFHAELLHHVCGRIRDWLRKAGTRLLAFLHRH